MADQARRPSGAPAGAALRRPADGVRGVALLRLAFLALRPPRLVGRGAERAVRALRLARSRSSRRAGGSSVDGRLGPALSQSLVVYLAGTGAAVVVGIALGALMGMVRPVGQMLDIYVHGLAATPRVAFIPLIILFLGLGFEAKILVVFLGAVMPVVLNSYAGVQSADPDLVEMARATGASRGRILAHVVLPGALPFLLAGVRIGATIGLINTVVAELYTAVSGLGGLLAIYGSRFQMAEYLAVVVVLAMIGVTMTEGLRLAERRMLRWRGPQ